MRILHVSDVAVGGVASLLRAFVAGQVLHGDDPRLLCPEPIGIDPARHERWPVRRRRPGSYPWAVRRLHQVMSRFEPDVVHLHSFYPGLLGRLPWLDAPRRVGVVYQPHGWNYTAATDPVSLQLLASWERSAARRSDALVVNCQDEAEEARQHGVRLESFVVGLPVDPAVFSPVDARQRRRQQELLTLSGRKVVVCLAALCWQKGQDRLVAAWEQDPPPDTVLVLVGGAGGPYLRRQGVEVLQRAAPREWGRSIVAVGHQDDVRPWLHAADVLVQPSRYEGMSVGMAEALCAGVPIVTFDVAGAREAVLDGPEGAAGAVVPQGDLASLMAELRRRLDEPGLLQLESTVARRRGLRLFPAAQVIRRLDAAYTAARGRGRSSGRSPGPPSCG